MGRERLIRWLSSMWQGQRGGMLIETVVLVSVFGILGSAVATSTQTSFIAKRVAENQATAENTIRIQVDYTLDQPFVDAPGSYISFDDPLFAPDYYPDMPGDGYSVTAEAEEWPDNPDVTLVRVEVSKDGELVRSFETLRTKR